MDKTITISFTFEKNGEEAIKLYVDLFDRVFGSTNGVSKILKITYFGAEELEGLNDVEAVPKDMLPGPVGSVKTIRFLLKGQEFVAVNGGGYFGKFHESVSLYISCQNQQQIDALWETLSLDGEEQPCGWVKDRFGISWQIVPDVLWEIDEGEDRARAQRVMNAIYHMTRIDIKKVVEA
ncbi:VOC family protein [Chitinophaga sp.]|uniref:VOC family protein n=1 Tax=Chitinophaga sp. TaxID=1869181 RepID=UPI0031E2620D